MDKAPTNNLISSDKALEGGGSLSNRENVTNTELELTADASRDDVVDAFMHKQIELSDSLAEISDQPGFNLDANQIMDKRSEVSAAKQQLDTFTETWTQLGGDEVIEAQQAVDELNFNSDASERTAAMNRLRDAKNAFYENYQATQSTEPTDEYQPGSYNGFVVGDVVRVKRTSGAIEDDWSVRSVNLENQTVEVVKPADNGQRLVKDVPIEVLHSLQEEKAPSEEHIANEPSEDNPKEGVTSIFESKETPLPGLESEAAFEAEVEAKELGTAAIDLSGADLLADSEIVAEHRAAKARRRARMDRIKASFSVDSGEGHSSGLLDDSEVVSDYLARKAKRRGMIRKAQSALVERRLNSETKKIRKQHKKELAAFDKAAARESVSQEAEDKAELKSAGHADRLEQKQFNKRLAAEAKLKAKQVEQTKKFEAREAKRLKRRTALYKAAARGSGLIGR